MPDKKLELSRRKILGSVGTVGAAGAAAGLGTSALFSDEESFENNSIAAGTLDLKVGWEEHYFKGEDRLDYTTSGDVSKSDVQYVGTSPASGHTTLPLDTTSPADGAVVSVPDDQTALGLLDVTEVDQRPDSTNTYDDVTDSNACSVLPDGSETSEVIIDLDDAKPGDEQSGSPDDSNREEFTASTKHDIGFAWWIPRSVGNQIQSDSATFSLSFYAVQRRNNAGSGSA